MVRRFAFALLILPLMSRAEPALRVAALHPLIADMARQAGGERVEVLDLMPPGTDAHHFEPTSQDIAKLKDCDLILASGMGLESYLQKLRDSTGLSIVEVGAKIPPLALTEAEEEHDHDHDHHGVDPHWWHSSDNIRRGLRVISAEYARADPEGSAQYQAALTESTKKLAEFAAEMRRKLSAIPPTARVLVTSHAAFGYFCQESHFEFVPVLGLQAEAEITPRELSGILAVIREKRVRAIFPEDNSNPKMLSQIAQETGAKIGKPLSADGTGREFRTFEAMTRHNVDAMVEALGN